MGELRQEFLKQTTSNLQILRKESFEKETFSEDFLRRFFRQLHTIKGTSRTFNLNNLAHFAHEIENLLQAIQNNQIPQTSATISLIQQSFEHLVKIAENYLAEKETDILQDFTAQIRAIIPNLADEYQKDLLSRQIPSVYLSQLSTQEKTNLNGAIQNGKTFCLLETSFNLLTFYEDFKSFKQKLNETGEAIAVLPSETDKPETEIAFKIFYVTNFPKTEIEKIIKSLKVSFVFESSRSNPNNADNLAGMVANLIADGKKITRILDKKIVFETSLKVLEISNQHLILLNQIATHLLTNAIDHAIETVDERIEHGKTPTAKIDIIVATVENKLLLQIEDNGKGIDFKKIIAHAKQKNLIAQDQVLDEKEALELIFSQGFSTSHTVSEISGRGVGLDAVKDLVENAGGKIEVETSLGKGTIFSVYLPKV